MTAAQAQAAEGVARQSNGEGSETEDQTPDGNQPEEVISKLAQLDLVEYDRCRKDVAKALRAPTTGRERLEHRPSKVIGQWHCQSAIKATAPRPGWSQNRLRLARRARLRYHSPLSEGFTRGISANLALLLAGKLTAIETQ